MLYDRSPGRYRFIDKNGKTVIEEKGYLIAGPFSEGRALIVRKSASVNGPVNNWDFIDANGNIVTHTRFERVGSISDGRAFVRLPSSTAYINTEGELVWPPTY